MQEFNVQGLSAMLKNSTLKNVQKYNESNREKLCNHLQVIRKKPAVFEKKIGFIYIVAVSSWMVKETGHNQKLSSSKMINARNSPSRI